MDFSGPSFMDAVFPVGREPETTFNFVVLVGVLPLGDFRSISGISYKMPVETIFEGGRNTSPVLLPFGEGKAGTWGEVTLKWGTPVWSTLYDWMNAVKVGASFRRDVSILQLRRNGWPSRIMRLQSAFPIQWAAAGLDSGKSEPDLESLTLTFESFQMLLTRTSDLPSLGDAAALAGRVTGAALDLADSVVDAVGDVISDVKDVFDGTLGQEMKDEFFGGVDTYGTGDGLSEKVAGIVDEASDVENEATGGKRDEEGEDEEAATSWTTSSAIEESENEAVSSWGAASEDAEDAEEEAVTKPGESVKDVLASGGLSSVWGVGKKG